MYDTGLHGYQIVHADTEECKRLLDCVSNSTLNSLF